MSYPLTTELFHFPLHSCQMLSFHYCVVFDSVSGSSVLYPSSPTNPSNPYATAMWPTPGVTGCFCPAVSRDVDRAYSFHKEPESVRILAGKISVVQASVRIWRAATRNLRAGLIGNSANPMGGRWGRSNPRPLRCFEDADFLGQNFRLVPSTPKESFLANCLGG